MASLRDGHVYLLQTLNSRRVGTSRDEIVKGCRAEIEIHPEVFQLDYLKIILFSFFFH